MSSNHSMPKTVLPIQSQHIKVIIKTIYAAALVSSHAQLVLILCPPPTFTRSGTVGANGNPNLSTNFV